MMVLNEKSGGHQSYSKSSKGEHESLYQVENLSNTCQDIPPKNIKVNHMVALDEKHGDHQHQ